MQGLTTQHMRRSQNIVDLTDRTARHSASTAGGTCTAGTAGTADGHVWRFRAGHPCRTSRQSRQNVHSRHSKAVHLWQLGVGHLVRQAPVQHLQTR